MSVSAWLWKRGWLKHIQLSDKTREFDRINYMTSSLSRRITSSQLAILVIVRLTGKCTGRVYDNFLLTYHIYILYVGVMVA